MSSTMSSGAFSLNDGYHVLDTASVFNASSPTSFTYREQEPTAYGPSNPAALAAWTAPEHAGSGRMLQSPSTYCELIVAAAAAKSGFAGSTNTLSSSMPNSAVSGPA